MHSSVSDGQTLGDRGQGCLEGIDVWTGEDAALMNHSSFDCQNKINTRPSQPKFHHEGERVYENPPLLEDLWIVDGFQKKGEAAFFKGVDASTHSGGCPYIQAMQDV